MLITRAERQMDLRTRLADARPMTSLMEREIVAIGPDIVAANAGWVPLFIDTGHAITMGEDSPIAYRAIDRRGHLLWLVEDPNARLSWLSGQREGPDAIARARLAWRRQNEIRRHWSDVRALARNLATGRRRLTVTLDDVRAAPVPSHAVDAFLSRMGLAGKQRISGRAAALLMKVEPAVGFVLWQAASRDEAPGPVETPERAQIS